MGTKTEDSHTSRKDKPKEELKSFMGDTRNGNRNVLYSIQETPSWFMLPLFGLQQAVMCIPGSLSVPIIITKHICAAHMPHVTAKILSISFFMCGVSTLLQNVIGSRLPIIQGGSHTYIPPIVAMMSLPKWKCPTQDGGNETLEEAWLPRMREIQGNLMLASLAQVILGSTGLIGFLLRFIGPLTIAPTISLIGLSLTGVVNHFSESQWGIAIFSLCLLLLFTLVLNRIKLPIPVFTRNQGCHVIKYPVFQLAPVLLVFGISWILCYALTITDVLPNNSTEYGYQARTDNPEKLQTIADAPWFFFPYPFQFGMPTVSVAGFIALLAATLSSIIESVGDYFAAARVSEAPPPPPHAINRGIAMEGLGSVISGMLGAGHATTSYSGNIGAIAITKVASRRVFQAAGLILLLCGIVGKFGAVITLIPEPIIGGVNAVLLGTVAAVGISTLQHVDMTSSRNLSIAGLALVLGLCIPQWIAANQDAIHTGSSSLDQVLNVLLGTSMFVGGFVGCFLDNVVPGTLEERGMAKWRENLMKNSGAGKSNRTEMSIYDLPFCLGFLKKWSCSRYIPFLPSNHRELELLNVSSSLQK